MKYSILYIISLSFIFAINKSENICAICSEIINEEYLVDSWGNPFHAKHSVKAKYCDTCSRIISKRITNGGFKFNDGRYICSLCEKNIIKDSNQISNSVNKILNYYKDLGIVLDKKDFSVELISLDKLISLNNYHDNEKIKGCTILLHDLQKDRIEIKILYGLNIVEFEGVLAHEIIHAWVYKNNLKFDDMTLEGLCNLGSAFIYRQNGSYLSSLLLSSIENNSDPIYGDGYNKMKLELSKIGSWKKLIGNINKFEIQN